MLDLGSAGVARRKDVSTKTLKTWVFSQEMLNFCFDCLDWKSENMLLTSVWLTVFKIKISTKGWGCRLAPMPTSNHNYFPTQRTITHLSLTRERDLMSKKLPTNPQFFPKNREKLIEVSKFQSKGFI